MSNDIQRPDREQSETAAEAVAFALAQAAEAETEETGALLRFDTDLTQNGPSWPAAIRWGERVQRPLLLFRAGEYPDKGVTVTREHLHQVVERFHRRRQDGVTVPVKLEHRDTVLDPLGEIVALYVLEEELFAMAEFSIGLNAHIEQRGARAFSAALLRDREAEGGGFTLKEASLVMYPRIADAGFLEDAPGTGRVAARLAGFRQAGKLTPAMEESARRLLSATRTLTFAAPYEVDVAEETAKLLSALPVIQPRQPLPGAASGAVLPPASESLRRLAAGFGLPLERLQAA